MRRLRPFALERFFAKYEFSAKFHSGLFHRRAGGNEAALTSNCMFSLPMTKRQKMAIIAQLSRRLTKPNRSLYLHNEKIFMEYYRTYLLAEVASAKRRIEVVIELKTADKLTLSTIIVWGSKMHENNAFSGRGEVVGCG